MNGKTRTLAQQDRPYQTVSRLDPAFLEVLVTAGESDAMRHLRHQIDVMAAHLRGAIIEAEAGLGAESLARQLHRLSGGDASLGVVDLTSEERLDALRHTEHTTGAILLGLDKATPQIHQHLTHLLQSNRGPHGPLRWWIIMADSAQTMTVRGELPPDLLRLLPAVTFRLVPLRERRQDVARLGSLLQRHAGCDSHLDANVIAELEAHAWPGNLDEMTRALEIWRTEHNPSSHSLASVLLRPRRAEQCARILHAEAELPPHPQDCLSLQSIIDRHLIRIMLHCNGNKVRAAGLLGVSRSTLYRMLESLNHSLPGELNGNGPIATPA